MIDEEKTVAIQLVYEGSIIRVERQTVELQNGRHASRDIVRHMGASAVVPVLPDRQIGRASCRERV